MRNGGRMLSVSDLLVFAKMLQCWQKPTKNQEMTEFRYYTVTLIFDFNITYITIWLDEYHYVFCYLSLVMDAYTEEIVGWSVGPTLETSYPIEALKMAMKRIEGKNDIKLIHHSDRGCQYSSSEYVRLFERMNIRISMT